MPEVCTRHMIAYEFLACCRGVEMQEFEVEGAELEGKTGECCCGIWWAGFGRMLEDC